MRLSARLVITALVLSLLAASLTAGILLARTFREDLASETGRGLDAYHMYTAALKASIEAFAAWTARKPSSAPCASPRTT